MANHKDPAKRYPMSLYKGGKGGQERIVTNSTEEDEARHSGFMGWHEDRERVAKEADKPTKKNAA